MHEIRVWLLETMKARNWSIDDWAQKAGIEPTIITRCLNDPAQPNPDAATLEKLSTAAGAPLPAGQPLKNWTADFSVFGRRTRRSVKSYSHAWGALAAPTSTQPEIGFARTRELAERQVSIRQHRGWSGPFEIVETTQDPQP